VRRRSAPRTLILLLGVASLAALLSTVAVAQPNAGVDDKIMGVERTLFDLPESGTEVDITRFDANWRGGIIGETFRYEHIEGGSIVTFKVESGKLAEAVAGFDERLGRVVSDAVRTGKAKNTKINDMTAVTISGSGLCGDDPCDFRAALYQSRPDTVIVAVAFVNNDKGKARLDEAAAFIGGVDLTDDERAEQRKPRKKKKQR